MNNPHPHTLASWLAFRRDHAAHLERLDLPTLAVVYGLSWRDPYQDPDLRRHVEALIDASPDPVYTRFILAYHSAAEYFDISGSWGWGKTGAGGEYGPIPPGQPGAIAAPPPAYLQQLVDWLSAGIHAYREDRGRMQLIHWLKYRALSGHTFLSLDHVTALESALGYEIHAAADPHAAELARRALENLERLNKPREG